MLPLLCITTALFFLVGPITGASAATADGDLARGEYLARIMECSGCHTPGALRGLPDFLRKLGGADIGIAAPLEILFGSNLTPELETGLGRWAIVDSAAALRTGAHPDGREARPDHAVEVLRGPER